MATHSVWTGLQLGVSEKGEEVGVPYGEDEEFIHVSICFMSVLTSLCCQWYSVSSRHLDFDSNKKRKRVSF